MRVAALRIGVWLVLACLASPAWAGPTGEPEPELRALMSAAAAQASSFDDRYLAEVWLTDMSQRLVRHVPKALPDPAQRLSFLRMVHAEATRAMISPQLVLAVIDAESAFQRLAVSSTGALGYMQIMPFWLEEIGRQPISRCDQSAHGLYDPQILFGSRKRQLCSGAGTLQRQHR